MKRIISSALIFVGLMGSSIYGEKDMECKNGVCPFNPDTVSTQEPALKQDEKSAVIELTHDNFDSVIQGHQKPIIVDFYASWCQPCKHMKPLFEELARTHSEYIFAACDGDKNRSIAVQKSVQAFPSFVIFKNGIQWGKIEGVRTGDGLLNEIKSILVRTEPAAVNQAELFMQLLMAINAQDNDALKRVLAQGVSINEKLETPQGTLTALSVAVMSGTQEIIDFLVASGAHMTSDLESSIKKQIENWELTIQTMQKNLEYCKNKIASLHVVTQHNDKKSGPEYGMRFMQAFANPEELKKLIDEGVEVNIVFSLGAMQTTPLCMAIALNNSVAMDMLIEAGAVLTTQITNEQGVQQTAQEGILEDLTRYQEGIIKSRERLAYLIEKAKK